MSARSFRPVIAVATVAAAALSCYLVSLRVATERANLEDVETGIVLAQRDIRTLQTEIDTRGRLEQLERWNVKVLALSAPKADQFLDGGYQLARLARPSDEININAPVVIASAPAPKPVAPIVDDDADLAATTEQAAPRIASRNDGAASIMHIASYSVIMKPAAQPVAIMSHPTKPSQIATEEGTTSLPHHPVAAKDSPHRDPAKTGLSRNTGTH